MITLEAVCAQVAGAQPGDVTRWVARAWVRPRRQDGEWRFEDIDIARVRLIVTLRDEMRMDEGALPVVLSLLDQLHAARRDMQALRQAIDEAIGAEQRAAVLAALERTRS